MRFEALEDRRLLKAATLWVDPNAAVSATVFNNFAAAQAAAHNGDTIKFISGIFHEELDITKSLTLIGGQKDVLGGPTGATIITPSTGTGVVLEANNITLKGFSIEFETTGIRTSGNFSGYNILNNVINGNVFGIDLSTSLAASAKTTTISGNVFKSDASPAVAEDIYATAGGVRNVVVSNNTFDSQASDAAIKINSANLSTNIQIVGNTLFDEQEIVVANATQVKVDGNTISQPLSTDEIHFAGGVTKSEINSNVMTGLGPSPVDAIVVDEASVGAVNSSIKISGNNLRSFQNGISLNFAINCTVSANHLDASGADGIALQNSSTADTVSGNTIQESGNYGIRLTQVSRNTVSKNNVSGSGLAGIFLQIASGNTVSSNVASYNELADGIQLIGSTGNSLTSNVSNFNDTGLLIEGSSSGNTIASNSTNSNSVGVIVFTNSNGTTLTKNTANNNLIYGFDMQGDRQTLKSNVAIGNGKGTVGAHGFFFTSLTHSLVTGNTANNNSGDGFLFLSGGSNTISGNTGNQNGNFGFDFDGETTSTISGNIANNNVSDGLVLEANTSGNTVTGNSAKGNSALAGGFDIADVSTGSGTDGKANTWRHNKAGTAEPVQLLTA